MSNLRRRLIAELPVGYPPEIARWLWVLADTRRRTLEVLDGLDDSRLDEPGPGGNSIGTILAHVAVIETDWLYVEILGEDYPVELLALLPPDVRDAEGHLLATPGLPLARHLEALNAVRIQLVERVGALLPEDLRHVRSLPDYDVSPEWVLHHLAQHEAEHRAEIAVTRAVLEGRRTH
ncbi:MAG: DinB family protein [Chloroflexota bacterium]|nr:DinB family protein [Chloroflexota bacterium]